MNGMQKGSHQNLCVDIILQFAKISASLTDEFFIAKTESVMRDILEACLNFENNRGADRNVAQYYTMYVRKSVQTALEFLDELRYLKLADPTPLFVAEKALLKLKVLLIYSSQINDLKRIDSNSGDIQKSSENPSARDDSKLSDSQKRILQFVNQAKTVRTKEIIDEFSSLSQRTVKRNLKDLVGLGWLRKKSENRAVYYSVSL